MLTKHQIVIVGGGNAGISVAAQLLRKRKTLDIAIIEPSTKHYYQPAWTLVGSGIFDVSKTVREEKKVMPKHVTWIKDKVFTFAPYANRIDLENGNRVSYDYLIVAAGIQLNWNAIEGLEQSLGSNNVCSNYSFKYAPYTFECIRNFKGGNAIFHNPETPVKCGGAPQKIMYMAADYFRRNGSLGNANIQFWSGGSRLFAIPEYEKTLLQICDRDNIGLHFHTKLVGINGAEKLAKFVGIGEENKDQEYTVRFDMLHVTPPQSAPDFIRFSPLADSAGWVDVDKHTLRHRRFPDIFSLGDCAGLPTSKTGAAIRKQAPVVVENILSALQNKPVTAMYNGYTSCPIATGYGKLMLAEFDYDNKRQETFPFDQSRERWSMFQLKRYVLPWLYWNRILPGKM
ncbi:MAG: NAD(P)/FAD-dependent oxidoreductase [Chitinophagaceae bacterium]|nr:NAD(P)/FAD-dependent oxidoreductase [Chitinophagaceae bacterium]